jgi:hypothetical protein
LQITLSVAEAADAAFVTVRTGNLLFVSGHIAKRDGKPWAGKLGVHLTTEEGKLAARSAAIDLLATLHHELQDLEKVKRIVKMPGLVIPRRILPSSIWSRRARPRFSRKYLAAGVGTLEALSAWRKYPRVPASKSK